MGEIRSTLDIIMEKTRGMTVSEEERVAFRKKALTGKIRGLVQKFLDDVISFPEISAEINAERRKGCSQVDEVFVEELIERFEPDGDHEKIFQLLTGLFNLETSPLQKAIDDFHAKLTREKERRLVRLRKDLEERTISGSAVTPNLAWDPTWDAFYEASRGACKSQFGTILGSQTTASQSAES